jgi:putative transposase
MATYRELTGAGVPTRAAAVLVGVARATATRRPRTPAPTRARVPVNKLTDAERAEILAVVNCPRFVDLPPIQIYAHLLDEGVYLGSISTIYRVLTENLQVKERRRLARHPARAIPELVATAPGQVYSWDITKLAGPVKGTYFDAYVMIDIYSRYIVGAHVHAHESAVLAAEMMREIFAIHGIPRVVHADRGTSMTSKTVAALLSDLEVTKSHSRPRVSNDNPYSPVVVQDVEVRARVPRTLRLPRRRQGVHGRLRRGLQPPPPSHRHRAEHPRRRPLRPRDRQGRRAVRRPGRRPRPPP